MSLEQIIEQLRSEHTALEGHGGKPAGRCCKYCNTFLAVKFEEPTLVHERNPLTQAVTVKCYYHGKAKCDMCHRYQA
jgi:hypothetical protein